MEDELIVGEGFNICQNCMQWLLNNKAVNRHIPDPNAEKKNRYHCIKGITTTTNSIINNMLLKTSGNFDALVFDIPLPSNIKHNLKNKYRTIIK